MDMARESKRWVELGIIEPAQRERILALYAEQGVSLAVLGILWIGGALVFLGVAFFLGMVWDELGALRGPLIGGIVAAFAGAGVVVRRRQPELEKTGVALLVIGGLLFPAALGVTWEDLFGSSGHFFPLLTVCAVVYALVGLRLRSRAFCVLFAAALFFLGEEVIRDKSFNALFPLVQLGVVRKLSDVFPLVFLTLGGTLVGLSFLAGRKQDYAHLRGTLLACGLIVALLPALVGGVLRPFKGLKLALAIASCLGGMWLSVALRSSRNFWFSGACLVGAFLILFADVFDDSLAFTAFAIVTGLLTMGAGSYAATRKNTWFERWFREEDALVDAEQEAPQLTVAAEAPTAAEAPSSGSEEPQP